MAWPTARFKTAAAGGTWTPADMNGVQDQYLRATGILNDDLDDATLRKILGLNQTAAAFGGAQVGRGKSIIATEESRTNVAYGLMPTPDRVQSVVLPTDGLIVVAYHAQFKSSGAATGTAGLFLGANQAIGRDVACAAQTAGTNTYHNVVTSTASDGLYCTIASGIVTTGMLLDPVTFWAAAGTYDVSIQFKASSGSVSARDRKLLVWTIGF